MENGDPQSILPCTAVDTVDGIFHGNLWSRRVCDKFQSHMYHSGFMFLILFCFFVVIFLFVFLFFCDGNEYI